MTIHLATPLSSNPSQQHQAYFPRQPPGPRKNTGSANLCHSSTSGKLGTSPEPEQVNAFFKLLDQRYGRKSTLITTNLAYEEWYQLFQRKSLVDAMLDRLKHHCVTINIDGPSLRAPDLPPDS
jgi:hypothetical protein